MFKLVTLFLRKEVRRSISCLDVIGHQSKLGPESSSSTLHGKGWKYVVKISFGQIGTIKVVFLYAVVVFNLLEPGNISRALCGDQVGTLIDQTGRIS